MEPKLINTLFTVLFFKSENVRIRKVFVLGLFISSIYFKYEIRKPNKFFQENKPKAGKYVKLNTYLIFEFNFIFNINVMIFYLNIFWHE